MNYLHHWPLIGRPHSLDIQLNFSYSDLSDNSKLLPWHKESWYFWEIRSWPSVRALKHTHNRSNTIVLMCPSKGLKKWVKTWAIQINYSKRDGDVSGYLSSRLRGLWEAYLTTQLPVFKLQNMRHVHPITMELMLNIGLQLTQFFVRSVLCKRTMKSTSK